MSDGNTAPPKGPVVAEAHEVDTYREFSVVPKIDWLPLGLREERGGAVEKF